MQSFSEDSKKFLRKDLLKKNLSKREIEVVMLVLEGSTNREVAHKLCVAEKTVKFHLTNVYKKLNISRRSQIFWKLPLADFISINEKPAEREMPATANPASAKDPEKYEESIPAGISTVKDMETPDL